MAEKKPKEEPKVVDPPRASFADVATRYFIGRLDNAIVSKKPLDNAELRVMLDYYSEGVIGRDFVERGGFGESAPKGELPATTPIKFKSRYMQSGENGSNGQSSKVV